MSNIKCQISNNRGNGQTLVELLVVITIGIIVFGALTIATISSLRNAQSAKNQAQATKLAQEGLERIRADRDRDAGITVSGGSVTSWSDPDLWSNRVNVVCGSCYFKLNSSSGMAYVAGTS